MKLKRRLRSMFNQAFLRAETRTRRQRRLATERLEDRYLLAAIHWDGGPTGTGTQWNDAENWVDDVLPGSSDEAVIDLSFTATTIEINADVQVAGIVSSAPLSLLSGSLTVGSATLDQQLTVGPGAVLSTGSGTYQGTGRILNQGSIFATGSTFSIGLENDGLFEVSSGNAWINGPLTTTSTSVIRIPAVDTSVSHGLVIGDSFSNNGLIELTSYATVGHGSYLHMQSGQLSNTSTGTIRSAVGTTSGGRFVEGSIVNQGTLQVQASLDIIDSVYQLGLVHSGAIVVESDAVLSVPYGVEINDPGTVSLATNATLNVSRLSGNLQNSSAFSGAGRIVVSSQIEMFSEDRGPKQGGFINNNALKNLEISGSVQLLDVSDNANGSLPEALYADTLILGLNSTLDLNAFKVYVRSFVDQGGTVLNGQIEVVPLLLSKTSILENQPVNSLIGRFSHFDASLSPEMQYELIGGDISAFKIVQDRLLSNVTFDFETKSQYEILVRATGPSGSPVEQWFEIEVINTSNAPVDAGIALKSWGLGSTAGTVIGELQTFDTDPVDSHSYSFVAGRGATDNSLFSIQGSQLVASAGFDFTNPRTYSIRVRATDSDGLFSDQVLRFTTGPSTGTGPKLEFDSSGPNSSGGDHVAIVGEKVFFTRQYWDNHPDNGLFVKNGNETTRLLAGKQITTLKSTGEVVYFTATGANGRTQLWQSDGTTQGTIAITSFDANVILSQSKVSSSGLDYIAVVGWSQPIQLYRLQILAGAVAQPEWVANIPNNGFAPYSLSHFETNGKTFIRYYDGLYGLGQNAVTSLGFANNAAAVADQGRLFYFSGGNGLQVSDGTVAGTYSISPSTQPARLFVDQGHIIVPGSHPDFGGAGVLKINSQTLQTTFLPSSLFLIFNRNQELLGGKILFSTNGGEGEELWSFDPNSGVASQVIDLNPGASGSQPRFIGRVGNKLAMIADDGNNGPQLYLTDGTAAGTVRMTDGEPFPDKSLQTQGSEIRAIPTTNDEFYVVDEYRPVDGEVGYSVWKSDGTPLSTTKLFSVSGFEKYDLEVVASNAQSAFYQSFAPNGNLRLYRTNGTVTASSVINASSQVLLNVALIIGDDLYFRISDTSLNDQLWVWKASSAAPELLYTFENNSGLVGMASAGSKLIFSRVFYSGMNEGGTELWASDGTVIGTTKLVGWPLVRGNFELVSAGPVAYFNGIEAPYGLWRTDGTVGGTFAVPAVQNALNLKGSNDGTVLFSQVSSSLIWVSDGSASGTMWLPGTGAFNPEVIGVNGGKVYFFGLVFVNDTPLKQLRVRDRDNSTTTVLGTFSVNVQVVNAISLGEGFVFRTRERLGASHAESRHEVWTTSGTQESTKQLFSRISPTFNREEFLVSAGGEFYFTALSDLSDMELWVSDGTVAGTAEVVSQLGSVRPQGGLAVINERLMFTGSTVNTGSAVFSFPLVDVNESPTDITLSSSSLAENSGVNAVVGSLSTSDPDAGNTFTYTLVTGDGSADNGAFNIVGDNLRANSDFDFETRSSYSVRVRSTDQDGLFFEKVFTISVTNVNEAPIDIALSAQSIAENLPIGTTVGTFSTSDPDAGNTFTYSLVSGDGSSGNSQFTIVGNQLRTTASFNFEVTSSYNIRVRSTDNGNLGFEKTFLITVMDVNESPTITITNVASPLAENSNTADSIHVANISITDEDGGTNTLSLSDADAASFEIVGGNQLHLRSGVVLDFETKPTYIVTVQSDDTTIPGNPDATAIYTLNIGNVNEHPTNITLTPSSVPENAVANTVVGTLATTDPDAGDTFTYTLISGAGSVDNAAFTIVGTQLTANSSFDFEQKSSYLIRVESKDAGNLTFEKELTISVSNVNERPTDIALSVQSIAENRPVGTTVGTFSTTDPDAGDAFFYLLVSGEGSSGNGHFTIVGNQLRAAASFNFEVASSYNIRVRSTDNGNLGFEKTFLVTVTDVNEAPTITITNVASPLAENSNTTNSILVADISLTDPDGGINTLSLSGADAARFEIIGGNQLHLRSGGVLDFETKPSYVVTVQSDDTTVPGTPDATATYALSISNVNEAPTGVQLSNRSVLENRPSGTLVGLLSAIDPDSNDTATFQLLPGQLDNAHFHIEGNQLQSARTFDAEEKWTYEIRVRVMDAGGLSVDRDLLIDISGENEWPPVFASPTSYSHPENITDVGLLNASDPDKPVSNVVYTIVGGADQARFSLVGPLLRMVPSPNFEVPSSAAGTNTFEVIVRASDGLFNVDQTLTINVTDANDLPTLPVIDGNTIQENMPTGTVIGYLSSSDDDGDAVSYFLVSGYGSTDNASFQIVGNELRSSQSFNYEFSAHRAMSIRVAATDGRGGIQQQTFTITTLDINEAPSGVEGNVSTDMNNAIAITLQGFDPENAGLTYSLVQHPRFGTLSGEIPDLLYTPNPNFVGQDELFFTVCDGTLLSTETRVLISVLGPKPTISFSTENVTVNEGVGVYSLTINSSIPLPHDLWVPFSVATTSTASELEDYSGIPPFLGIRIPAGKTTGTTSIQILDDLMFEHGDNETLVIDLVNNPFSTIGTLSRFTLSIAENDVAPLVQFSSPGASVLEGASQTVTVRLTGRSTQTVTVPFSIDSSSTAAFGADYNTLVPSSSLVFTPGEIAKTISIPLINDQNVELTETLRINLGTPINATLSTVNRSFTLTIIDDDKPTVSMSTLTRSAKETTGQVTVTATLSQATSNEIVVPYILGGIATSGVSGSVDVLRSNTPLQFVFAPGQVTATATFIIQDDTIVEPTETFEVRLAQPATDANYTLGRVSSTVFSIQDNDRYTVFFSTPIIRVWEDAGTVSVTATLSSPAIEAFSVPITVSSNVSRSSNVSSRDKATLGRDFNYTNDRFYFGPGANTSTLSFSLIDDSANEPTESARIALSPASPSYRLGSINALELQIMDDDPLVSLVSGGSQVYESTEITTTITHTVKLTAPTNEAVTVPFRVGGTARQGIDYSVDPSSGSITIPEGSTSASIVLSKFNNNNTTDGNRSVSVSIGDAPGLRGSPTTVSTEIVDDDQSIVSFKDDLLSVKESRVRARGRVIRFVNRSVNVQIAMSSPAVRDVFLTVEFGGNATYDVDYKVNGLRDGKIRIPAGSTSASVRLDVISDRDNEGVELIQLRIIGVTSPAKLAVPTIESSIFIEDDGLPSAPPRPPVRTTSQVPILAGTLALELPDLGQQPLVSAGGSSSTRTITPSQLQAMVAGSLNIGAINQGSIFNGLVFFDANFNGIADEDEPFAMTTADGAFAIPVEESFDTNANGQIEPSEGRWVAIDGTDISIGELWKTQLAAPVGMFSITPITTLIESVVRNRSLSVSEASTLTLDALGITNFDLWSRNALFDILAYDLQASEVYKIQVQLYATVIQLAELLAARTGLTVSHVANEVYTTLSELISPDGTFDFGSSIHVEALLRSAITKLGIEMEQDVLTGASEVMAESQRFVGGIMLSDHETGNSFLLQVNKAKKVLQGRLPAAMGEVGAGTRSISSLVSSFTGAALQAEISSQSVSVTVAPVVGINSLSIHEGNAGSSILRFSVEIVGEHDYPVSVGFTTVPGTATAEVDYLSHSGTITWPAGDSSTKFIDVTILGDSIHEFDETFKVLLLNADGIAVRFAEGTAYIVNDDLKVVQPIASDTVNQWRIARSTDLDFAVIQNETIHLSGLYMDPVRVNVPGADHIPDHYRVDFSSISYLSDVYSLAGGSGVHTDTFQAIAGFFDTIEHTLIDSGNSKIRFIPSASTSGVASPEATVVELESVESVSLSPSELSTLIVHVPSSITELTVMDADPYSLGRNRIFSPTNAFAPIEFTNPGSLVIRRANAATMVTLGTLDSSLPASNISVHTILSLGDTVSGLLEGTRSQRVKVADVVLDPYAVGPHLLRLDGEHKALFELDGQSLFLKANSTLDFETLPTVSVKIILDDPNLVGSADAEVLYSLEVGNGDLIVDDSNGIDNRTSIRLVDDGGDLYLEVRDETDQFAAAPAGWTLTPDNKAIRTLASAFTGTITVNAAGGDDTLTVDFSGGTGLPNIIFDGGIGGFDTLEVVGGDFSTITKTFTNASDGNVVLSDGPAVTYIGLEPVLLNVGSVGDIVFHLPATVSAATLANDGTALKLSGADFEDTTFPNPTGSLAINRGNAADTLIIGSTISNLTSTLTVGTDASPFHSIIVSGALALNSGNNIDLGLYATRIAVSAAVSARNITLDADTGSQVTGDFIGVNITANVTGTGEVQVAGRGGDGSSSDQHGVQVASGAVLSGFTTAVHGLVGASTAGFLPSGVHVVDPNSRITSGGGNVQVKGEASIRGSGVVVGLGGQITSGGSGSVTVEGTGNAVGNVSYGVYLYEGQITSGGSGAVAVTGTGGSGASNNFGVVVFGNSSRITSGGMGTVSVEGTGGSMNAGSNIGVWTTGGQITSGGGAVTVRASSHINNTTAAALRLENSGGISSGGNAPVLITANSVTINAGGFINSGTGTTTIRPRTAGTLINLGGADVLSGSSLTLGLTDTELDQITAGTLQIGDANSGTITVSAALTHNNGLSLTTGAGITLNQAITMASDRNFSAATTSTTMPINLATTDADIATSGTGSVSLTATRNIALASGSSVTTVNGNLSLSANQQPSTTSGNFTGIDVNNALIQATGTGNASVLGRGGNDAAGSQFGVLVRNGADIIGGTTGTVTVNGSGGVSSGSDNYGVYVVDNGSTITSSGGAVSVTGIGGDAGSGFQNFGIVLFSGGQITAGSSGTVTVIGTGGASSGNSNHGVVVQSTNSTITSGGGAVSVTGTGGGAGSSIENIGVYVLSGGQITAGSSGTVTVIGTGGTSSGNFNLGVRVDTNATITSSGGAVSVTGTGGSSSGASVQNMGIFVFSGGQITSGASGTVTVTGTGGVSSGVQQWGILVQGTNSAITSGGGAVSVVGTGGGVGASNQNTGIYLVSGGQISAGSSGTVTVIGTGGASSGNSNLGVRVEGGNSRITSSGGAVSVTGTGGGVGSSSANVGIFVNSGGQITAGSSGTVTVIGTGGASSGNFNHGLAVQGPTSASAITSGGGAVSVTGIGGGAASSVQNMGIFVGSGGQISAGASGTVTVFGSGGASSGDFNFGVRLAGSNARITSGGGVVSVTGTEGGGSSGTAISIVSGAEATATTGGTLNLIGNSMDFDSFSVISAGATGSVTLRPRTNGTLINLGGADVLSGSPLTLGLTDAELDRVTAGKLVIGSSNSGAISITSDVSRPASTDIELHSPAGTTIDSGVSVYANGGIVRPIVNTTLKVLGSVLSQLDLPAGSTVTGTGSIVGNLTGAGTVAPGDPLGAIAVGGNYSLGGSLVLDIEGANAGTQYDQLNVNGTVTLTGNTLTIIDNFPGITGQETFAIVQAGMIVGTFDGLPEGSIVSINSRFFKVNYSSTDVRLTPANLAPTSLTISDALISENNALGDVAGEFATVDPNVGDTFTYTLVSGDGSADNGAFDIVGDSLRANSSFDFETKSSYSVRVRSTDQGGLFIEKVFTISVTNVNESPTDITLSSSSLAENAGVNAVVGSLSTSDPDAGNTFTYTLVTGDGSADNGAFNIDGDSLRANSDFDFETKSSYSVRVRSTDQDGLFFENIFTITVTDVPEGTRVTGTSGNDLLIATYTGDGSTHGWSITRNGINVFSGVVASDGLIIDGLGGTDTLQVVGRSIDDVFQLSLEEATVNGAVIRSSNIETLRLLGGSGNDELTLLGGPVSGVTRIFEGGSGTDTLKRVSGSNIWNVTASGTGNLDTAGNLSFTAVESLVGGDEDDQFIFGASGALTGRVLGGDGSDTISFASRTVAHTINLQNNTATATGGIGEIENFIGSNAPVIDVIIGANVATDWTIDAANSGVLNSAATGLISFVGFENLTGGTGADAFVVGPLGSISGTINGGSGVDSLDLSAKAGEQEFRLDTTNSLPGTVGSYTGFEQIAGNGDAATRITRVNNIATSWSVNALGQIVVGGVTYSGVGTIFGGPGADTLTGPAGSNTWTIDSADGGTLSTASAAVSFSGIENLTGSTGADAFVVGPLGSISGTMNGGSGVDSLDLSAKAGEQEFRLDTTSSLPGTVGSYTGFEQITGNGDAATRITRINSVATAWSVNASGQIVVGGVTYSGVGTIVGGPGTDTLTGPAGSNTWTIHSADGGTLSTASAAVSFSGIENLTGSTGADAFVVGPLGSISGTMNGGTGVDSLDLSAKAGEQEFRLDTTSSLPGIVGSYTGFEQITGNGNAGSRITRVNSVATSWSVNASGQIVVSSVTYSGVGAIFGGPGTDTLTGPAGSNTWTIDSANGGTLSTASAAVSFSGIENLTGGTGADTFIAGPLGSISGTMNGGSGVDSLDLSAKAGEQEFRLDTTNSLPGTVGSYTGIEQITGNGNAATRITRVNNIATSWSVNASGQIVVGGVTYSGVGTIFGGPGADTLTGPATDNTWTVQSANAGLLAIPSAVISFAGIENLTGSTGSDAFEIVPGGSLSGALNGGTGAAINSLSYVQWVTDVTVNLSVTTPGNATGISGLTSNIQMVTGGAGNDQLTGQASRSTILIGLGGNDTLIGGSQRDLLFGGSGADVLQAVGGDDLLISGTTAFDTNRAAILELYAEWISTRTFAQRTANIWGNGTGTRSNGNTFLNSDPVDGIIDTVFADNDIDTLFGGSGQDWFFGLQSEITDFVGTGSTPDRRNN